MEYEGRSNAGGVQQQNRSQIDGVAERFVGAPPEAGRSGTATAQVSASPSINATYRATSLNRASRRSSRSPRLIDDKIDTQCGHTPRPSVGRRRFAGQQEESDMKDAHNKAAEHHESAAKSHRAAAEHYGKNDHAKGKEHSTQAQQHAQNAQEHSTTANSKSAQQK
jgi:hypothetical protein